MNKSRNKWKEAQEWEAKWWSDCRNTIWEEVKQMNLAPYLGLQVVPNEYTNYRIPMKGETILDIGGGPSSILLKMENIKGTVIDPCDYPQWVADRYKTAGIEYLKEKAEDLDTSRRYDEVLIYNCLQHTEFPKKIIDNAKKVGKLIRLFEWVNTRVNEGHPHAFTPEQLEEWLGGKGKVTKLSGGGLYGTSFSGVFLGENYDSKTEKEI
jgi:hypothetical protein